MQMSEAWVLYGGRGGHSYRWKTTSKIPLNPRR
jgi:hypothetical protein